MLPLEMIRFRVNRLFCNMKKYQPLACHRVSIVSNKVLARLYSKAQKQLYLSK